MEFKVLSVLKKFIPEEQFETLKGELGKFEVELNKDITKYVTANTPNKEELAKAAKETAHKEVITALKIDGVETVEQLNAHMKVVNDTTTDKDAEIIKLTKLSEKLQKDYDGEVATRTKLEKDTTLANQMAKINKLVGDDEKQAKFLHWDLSQQVSDELSFDDALAKYEEENPPQQQSRFVDPRFSKKVIPSKDKDGYEIFKEMKAKGIL